MKIKPDQTLKTVDHNTGFLTSELKSFVGAGAQSATTGAHFDAVQVLGDNLGSAVGNAIVTTSTFKNPAIEDLSLAKDLKEMDTLKQDFNNYLARQLEGGGSYFW